MPVQVKPMIAEAFIRLSKQKNIDKIIDKHKKFKKSHSSIQTLMRNRNANSIRLKVIEPSAR